MALKASQRPSTAFSTSRLTPFVGCDLFIGGQPDGDRLALGVDL